MPKRPPALARAPGGAAGPPPSAPCVRPERPVGSRIRDPVDFYGKKGSPWHRSSLAASLQPDNRSAFNPSSSGWGSSYDASGGPTSPDPKIPTPGTAGCLAAEITGKKKIIIISVPGFFSSPKSTRRAHGHPKALLLQGSPLLAKKYKKKQGGGNAPIGDVSCPNSPRPWGGDRAGLSSCRLPSLCCQEAAARLSPRHPDAPPGPKPLAPGFSSPDAKGETF